MLWNVPITIATKNNPETVRFVLEKASDTVTIEGVGPGDWILVIKTRMHCGGGDIIMNTKFCHPAH